MTRNFPIRLGYLSYTKKLIDSPVFLEIKRIFSNQSGQEQFLFNHKDILIHGHSIFYRNWFDRGIYLVHDLLQADRKFFLTQNSSKNICKSFLLFLDTFHKVRGCGNPTDRSDLLLGGMFQLSPEISINLTKMKNRLLSAPHKQRAN